MFQPTAAQQADLDAFLAAAAEFHVVEFSSVVTPEQYAIRFGIAQSDLNKVTVWLCSRRDSIIGEIPRSRNWIVLNWRGRAGRVRTAQ